MTPLCPLFYREIPLTQGQVAIIDAADYDLLAQHKWRAQWHPRTRTFYAHATSPRSAGKELIAMHRHLLGLRRGDGIQVDHVNLDTLDNRRSNIRIATRSQNMANRRMFASNMSGFKGISKVRTKWRAVLQINHRTVHIGYFDSPEDAHQAYRAAALDAFKEFAHF